MNFEEYFEKYGSKGTFNFGFACISDCKWCENYAGNWKVTEDDTFHSTLKIRAVI